ALGALILTGPAAVVGHQYLRIDTPVAAVVEHIAAGLVAGGRLAWGVTPVALFFAATAPASWFAVFLGLAGAVTTVLLGRAATGLQSLAPRQWAWTAVVTGWVVVTVAITLRLALSLLLGA
ncbi:MAG: hypothetical protein R3F59_39235, partial [Myxococcota bacterium]